MYLMGKYYYTSLNYARIIIQIVNDLFLDKLHKQLYNSSMLEIPQAMARARRR